ncbi:MAG: glycosyltransferase [Acidobacteriota bacterium]|nr:glycosyltransferase [Acidobacteriota bacterium]
MKVHATTPLVTVLVPAFNAERFLRQSLESITATTWPHCEILVLDDGSTDSTPDIIRSFGAQVRHVRHPRNLGQFPNVEDGIARAQGKYIAVYHADDIYHPAIIEREVAYLEQHPNVGVVFCMDRFIDGSGRVKGELRLPAEVSGEQPLDFGTVLNAQLLYKNRFLRTPSSMARATVYREAGPFRASEFPVAADLEMFLRIARKHPVAILQEYLLHYRWGHGNADQRERMFRNCEEPFFAIIDEYLEGGGRKLVTRAALDAFEAHRNEDRLMRVIKKYIVADAVGAKQLLSDVRPLRVARSNQVQRGRLLLLWAAMAVLTRVPRVVPFANLFFSRWHGRKTRV